MKATAMKADAVITVVPARHTVGVLVIEAICCFVLLVLLGYFARTRSRWMLAACVPVCALAIVMGCYGYANDHEIAAAQYPTMPTIAAQLGLRSLDGQTYYDAESRSYTDCSITTNSLDERRVTSTMTCVLDNKRVTVTRTKD